MTAEASAILPRRRRDRDGDMPIMLRVAIKSKLRRDDTLTVETRRALENALYDDDGMETLSAAAQAEGLDTGDAPRDWAGFFSALAAFIEKILPLILKLFGM
jgi:hypothetical protein